MATASTTPNFFKVGPYWQLDVDRRSATLTVVPRDGPQARAAFFVHSMLLTPVRTASWLAAHPLPLDEVRLAPRFRSLRAETRFLFGCEPRFAEGPPRIVFPAELARLPVVRRPDEVGEYARTSLRRMLLAAPAETLHARLRALLSSTTPVAAADIGETSRRLGVSRATLARRLAREGTSFQALKDDVRRDHAIALLTGSPLPLGEIAERLGYSAQSAFQRAFRDWTGVSPGRFRAR